MSRRITARLAGILYLVVAVAGGFAQLGARSSFLVVGDASATADNIRANAALFQLGFAADAVNIAAFVGVGLLLHAVLSPVSPRLSGAFVTLVAVAAAIMGLDLANHAGALIVATDPSFAAALGAAAADALAALFLNLHQYGYLVAEVFFGLWLLPLGVAVYRSGYFPRPLGIGLGIGSFAYLSSFTVTALSPGFESDVAGFLALPAGLAEVTFLVWLLFRGADVPADQQPLAPSAQPILSPEATRWASWPGSCLPGWADEYRKPL